LGQRSRKRGRARSAATAPPSRSASAPTPSRSQRRDEEARAALTPLAPNERPLSVTIAVAVAILLALGNVLAYFVADVSVRGEESSAFGVVLLAAILAAAAWGMWNLRYWAVLGFQALLALTVLYAALSLIVASNLIAVALCLTIVALGGWLFWKLVRAMARIQMPARR
jgi:hypothetical protein